MRRLEQPGLCAAATAAPRAAARGARAADRAAARAARRAAAARSAAASSGSSSGGSNGPPLIYAHTDTELYSIDPTSHQITDIGPFSDGTGSPPTITDLAVDGNDNVWVNSETAIYKAALPASGTGTVTITLQTSLPSGTKFYALGFTPAGMLEQGESLIAGDSSGSLYYVDVSSSSATPLNLGSFGQAPERRNVRALGRRGLLHSRRRRPRAWRRSGRATSSCTSTDDYLAEVDIAALQQAYQSKSPATSLLKQMVGASGTGYGRLFGVGAWGNSVYAFSREATGLARAARADRRQRDGHVAAVVLEHHLGLVGRRRHDEGADHRRAVRRMASSGHASTHSPQPWQSAARGV